MWLSDFPVRGLLPRFAFTIPDPGVWYSHVEPVVKAQAAL